MKALRPAVWGLTGGMGSGKSTAAAFFRTFEVPVIDADALAKEALLSPLVEEVRNRFPAAFDSQGSLDRQLLGKQVFSHREDLQWLNNLVHPYVQRRFLEEVRQHAAADPMAILYDVPLLFENQMHLRLDGVVVVNATSALQRERISLRNPGWTTENVLQRLAAQMPLEDKVKQADMVLQNMGSLDDLKDQVKCALSFLKYPPHPRFSW